MTSTALPPEICDAEPAVCTPSRATGERGELVEGGLPEPLVPVDDVGGSGALPSADVGGGHRQ